MLEFTSSKTRREYSSYSDQSALTNNTEEFLQRLEVSEPYAKLIRPLTPRRADPLVCPSHFGCAITAPGWRNIVVRGREDCSNTL